MSKRCDYSRVRVYRNLNRNCLSVQARIDGRWKVIEYVAVITLCDVRFKVLEAGRQRVLREKRKNVHAFVEGAVFNEAFSTAGVEYAGYDPYRNNAFVTSDGKPIYEAAIAQVTTDGIILLRKNA